MRVGWDRTFNGEQRSALTKGYLVWDQKDIIAIAPQRGLICVCVTQREVGHGGAWTSCVSWTNRRVPLKGKG